MNNDISAENTPKLLSVKKYLFQYYYELKSRIKGEDSQPLQMNIDYLEEIILNTRLQTILQNIKETTECLINNSIQKTTTFSVNNNNNYSKTNIPYEKLLQKYENDIRCYSKMLFQYKRQCEALEMKLESMLEMEEEFEEMKEKYKYIEGTFLNNDKKDNEIFILRTENSTLKKVIDQLELDKKQLQTEGKNKKEIIISLKNKNSPTSNNWSNLHSNDKSTRIEPSLSTFNSMKLYMKYNQNDDGVLKEDSNLPSSSAYNSPFGKSTNELSSSTIHYNNSKVKSTIQSAKKLNLIPKSNSNKFITKKKSNHHKTNSMNMNENIRKEIMSKYISNYQYEHNNNVHGKNLHKNYNNNKKYLNNKYNYNNSHSIRINNCKGNEKYLKNSINKSSSNSMISSLNQIKFLNNQKNSKSSNQSMLSVRSTSKLNQH
jgi:hypothetical protein